LIEKHVHKLAEACSTIELKLNNTHKQLIIKYLHFLFNAGKKVNLYSAGDRNYLVERHIMASILFADAIKRYESAYERIIDFGSGAGFPGILISILLNPPKIVLLDSNRKKTLFLKKVINELSLSAVVECNRIENLQPIPEKKYDIVTARSVTSIENLYRYGRFVLKNNGRIYTLKGDNFKTEIENKENKKITEIMIPKSITDYSNYFKNKTILKMERQFSSDSTQEKHGVNKK
jgi:16S rRNA (guanine527-N7)-methyltransferase